MNENILVAIAWPYANADIHVGNITGSHLPGDIVARYHRLRGNKVLMVSGSDSHGTAITIKADQKGLTPHEIYSYYHPRFIELFQRLGISYDLFTSTHTENHFSIAQKVFLTLLENGFLKRDISKQWYSPSQERFLPDRYVEGTCYICGAEGTRSDQCEKCGHELEAEKLINPRSKVDGSTPILKETEHFFLDLSTLEPRIQEFLKEREDYWRPNVLRQSLGTIQSVGLKPTSITRDLEWGIPVPLDDWQGKCLYVWFEAVMGYLSSTVEWSDLNDNPIAWRDWWTNQQAKSFYFIGKDNITFHAVTWPAELLGMGADFDRRMESFDPQPLVLPYDVPANEFMNLEGKKISGSHNWAVWGLDALDRYDSDALRYYLTTSMPEARDTDWDWEEFFQRNNNELVATWGNLVNRVLGFTAKHADGVVPDIGDATSPARDAFVEQVAGLVAELTDHMEHNQLRKSMGALRDLWAAGNAFWNAEEPWKLADDPEARAIVISTALHHLRLLAILGAPVLPDTSPRVLAALGIDDLPPWPTDVAAAYAALPPGTGIEVPSVLFAKIEPEQVAAWSDRFGCGDDA